MGYRGEHVAGEKLPEEQLLYFQEAAYFRHESGRIFRPIVVSLARSCLQRSEMQTARGIRVCIRFAVDPQPRSEHS
jgi:hypothetical protein